MEIRQCRVVLRARNFDRTCHFYGEVMALPGLQSWEREDGRGARFQVGPAVLEVLGRPRAAPRVRDENFDYQGPQHKITLSLVVPSAQKAYEEMLLRDRNVPGGLRTLSDGTLAFETHDPDGVKVVLLETVP